MSALQDCLDKFSKKLSIILEAQGVSVPVHLLRLVQLLYSSHDNFQLQ